MSEHDDSACGHCVLALSRIFLPLSSGRISIGLLTSNCNLGQHKIDAFKCDTFFLSPHHFWSLHFVPFFSSPPAPFLPRFFPLPLAHPLLDVDSPKVSCHRGLKITDLHSSREWFRFLSYRAYWFFEKSHHDFLVSEGGPVGVLTISPISISSLATAHNL